MLYFIHSYSFSACKICYLFVTVINKDTVLAGVPKMWFFLTRTNGKTNRNTWSAKQFKFYIMPGDYGRKDCQITLVHKAKQSCSTFMTTYVKKVYFCKSWHSRKCAQLVFTPVFICIYVLPPDLGLTLFSSICVYILGHGAKRKHLSNVSSKKLILLW